MNNKRRQRILSAPRREVHVENPSTIQGQLFERKSVNGTITKIPHTCRLVAVADIPYKVLRQEGPVATCQEVTAQDMADWMEQRNRFTLFPPCSTFG